MKKINTVKKYREFKEILNKRKFIKNELFCVYFRDSKYDYSRYGILLTKKNGNAVIRNKIKRQMRSIIDSVTTYKVPIDVIVVVNKKYDVKNFNENKDKLASVLLKILGESNEEKI